MIKLFFLQLMVNQFNFRAINEGAFLLILTNSYYY